MINKILIVILLFNFSISKAQKKTTSNKILLDSISHYICMSEDIKTMYWGYTGYTIDTINLAIHFPWMDVDGPGKASSRHKRLSIYFNYLSPVYWINDSSRSKLALYIKGDDDFGKFTAEFRICDNGSKELGRFNCETTSYYYYEIVFEKAAINPKKQIMLSSWINQLRI